MSPWLDQPTLEQRNVLLATHEDTLDCPELNASRTPEEIVAAFRPTVLENRSWWSAYESGQQVGVVLFEGGTDNAVELSYLGLIPSARGRGLAAAPRRDDDRRRPPAARGGAGMSHLPTELTDRLTAAGLDPASVHDHVVAAVANKPRYTISRHGSGSGEIPVPAVQPALRITTTHRWAAVSALLGNTAVKFSSRAM